MNQSLLQESDLLSLLKDEEDAEDKLIQTDISDENLLKVLDRSDLLAGDSEEVHSFPIRGPGWEVVIPTKSGGGMLSSLSS